MGDVEMKFRGQCNRFTVITRLYRTMFCGKMIFEYGDVIPGRQTGRQFSYVGLNQ